MNICFVTPELTPLAKVGGLADVSTALPVSLHESGHNIRVILPFYRDLKIDHSKITPIPGLEEISIELGSETISFQACRCPFPGSSATMDAGSTEDESTGAVHDNAPELILVNCDHLYDREGIYGSGSDESLRFLFLSRAALEICQHLKWAPDVVHCNDWQTAMIPVLLRSVYGWDSLFENTRTVLTIHNIGHQGVFPASILPSLNLRGNEHLLHQDDLSDGVINFLKTGCLHADTLTAVSPTYAQQIQGSEYGEGLEEILSGRSSDLHGILNGIDNREWNPQTDSLIAANFSVEDLEPKLECKRQLLSEMNVDVDLSRPTIGVVSRLAGQKGFDLMIEAMPQILRERDIRFVILGSGEQGYVNFFSALRRQFPDRVGFYHGFSNELAHQVEAGSDMFLMPSKYEPCGLNQMYSQVYGTIPIVRRTGGLADTVEQFDMRTGDGTGFVFDHYTSVGLRWAVNMALDVFGEPQMWHRLVVNAMSRDFSWQKQAQQYVKLYEETPVRR